MNDKLQSIVNCTVYILVKDQNVKLLQDYCMSLKKILDDDEFLTLFDNFFEVYADNLEEDDISFFQDMMDDFICKTDAKKKEMLEDEHLRKIKKQIIFFKKKFNWELGKDYSFKKGFIFMSKKNKQKLRESIG